MTDMTNFSIGKEKNKQFLSTFEKGGKTVPIGTVRVRPGGTFVKTADGWKYKGKGTGVKKDTSPKDIESQIKQLDKEIKNIRASHHKTLSDSSPAGRSNINPNKLNNLILKKKKLEAKLKDTSEKKEDNKLQVTKVWNELTDKEKDLLASVAEKYNNSGKTSEGVQQLKQIYKVNDKTAEGLLQFGVLRSKENKGSEKKEKTQQEKNEWEISRKLRTAWGNKELSKEEIKEAAVYHDKKILANSLKNALSKKYNKYNANGTPFTSIEVSPDNKTAIVEVRNDGTDRSPKGDDVERMKKTLAKKAGAKFKGKTDPKDFTWHSDKGSSGTGTVEFLEFDLSSLHKRDTAISKAYDILGVE